jgi:hypothetical protein
MLTETPHPVLQVAETRLKAQVLEVLSERHLAALKCVFASVRGW